MYVWYNTERPQDLVSFLDLNCSALRSDKSNAALDDKKAWNLCAGGYEIFRSLTSAIGSTSTHSPTTCLLVYIQQANLHPSTLSFPSVGSLNIPTQSCKENRDTRHHSVPKKIQQLAGSASQANHTTSMTKHSNLFLPNTLVYVAVIFVGQIPAASSAFGFCASFFPRFIWGVSCVLHATRRDV